MPYPIYHVDAFAHAPFTGNPAAVCLLDAPGEAAWMQAVAADMNLSETAFVSQEGDVWRLRWFTPKAEVALCGHATLASAHVLWDASRVSGSAEIVFETLSGPLTCRRRDDWIRMGFPATRVAEVAIPGGLVQGLGIERAGAKALYAGRNDYDYLVQLENEEDVRALEPDFRLLNALPVRGVIVTARASTPGYDFVSRFFAPAVGIDEDPVTGSAHCTLGPFWAERLGKREMVAYQASTRGGIVLVSVTADRVELGGRAVTVARGELVV